MWLFMTMVACGESTDVVESGTTRDGQTVQFSELQEGQQVEVEVEKTGQRLDPISVRILE